MFGDDSEFAFLCAGSLSAHFLFLGEVMMRKLLAVLIFPIIWITSYLYRIICVDLIGTIIQIFKNLFTNLGLCLFLLVTLPLILLVEIPIAFILTCTNAVSVCGRIISGKLDLIEGLKVLFPRNDK